MGGGAVKIGSAGVRRAKRGSLAIVGDGTRLVARLGVRNAAVEVGGRVAGLQSDRFIEVGDGTIELAPARIAGGAVIVGDAALERRRLLGINQRGACRDYHKTANTRCGAGEAWHGLRLIGARQNGTMTSA
jgi:hypothetical protein